VIHELRSAGWKAPAGSDNIESEDDEDGGGFSTSTKGGMHKKKNTISKKNENPIAKMRRLREALTQSGSSSGAAVDNNSNNSSSNSNNNSNNTQATPTQHTTSVPTPPSHNTSASTTPNKPPMTPETNSLDHLNNAQQVKLAADLGQSIDIVDRNPRDIGFAPPQENGYDATIMGGGRENEGSSMNPVDDSLNRTERFLEKRRKRDQKLQSQVDKDRIKREARASVHAQQTQYKARRTSSREGKRGGRLPGL
jgi:hypothetical protein